jgi:thiol-disulfide isomerase/thioredoxin
MVKASFAQPIKKVKIKDVVNIIDTTQGPLVVNFWASWCQPCVHEIPWFEKSIAELKDKNIQLVLVSLDFRSSYPKELNEFVKKHGYTSKIVWLEETNADYFCPLIDKGWDGNIPVTIMVNHKKNYRQFFSEQIPEAKLKLELQKLIE